MAIVNVKREDEIGRLESLEDELTKVAERLREFGLGIFLDDVRRKVGDALNDRYIKRARDAR